MTHDRLKVETDIDDVEKQAYEAMIEMPEGYDRMGVAFVNHAPHLIVAGPGLPVVFYVKGQWLRMFNREGMI